MLVSEAKLKRLLILYLCSCDLRAGELARWIVMDSGVNAWLRPFVSCKAQTVCLRGWLWLLPGAGCVVHSAPAGPSSGHSPQLALSSPSQLHPATRDEVVRLNLRPGGKRDPTVKVRCSSECSRRALLVLNAGCAVAHMARPDNASSLPPSNADIISLPFGLKLCSGRGRTMMASSWTCSGAPMRRHCSWWLSGRP